MDTGMRDILNRLSVLEGKITPTDPGQGLNPQQKSVKQLPALFKPGNISPTLSKKPYQKHPMDGWLVGEDQEEEEEALEEAQANEEKLLDKVKKSFIDYLDSVEDAVAKKKDRDIGQRPVDHGVMKKQIKDLDLIPRAESALEDATQEEPAGTDQTPTAPTENPTYAESAPVKTVTMEDGRMCEIHGDEHSGFEIRHGNRRLPSRFRNLDEAEMAIEMYRARRARALGTADYLDEA